LYQDKYSIEDKHDCQTLMTCFMMHVGYGMMAYPIWDTEGMISPEIDTQFYPADHNGRVAVQVAYITGAVLLQLFYVIVVNLVLGAIISGLIIDTFSEMRSDQERVEEDINGNCFICGIDRDDFEKAGVKFHEHTRHHHNMWKYLHLELHLEFKDKSAYTSQDVLLAKSFTSQETFVNLMPLKKAMALESQKLKEKNDLSTLFTKVNKITKVAGDLEKEQVEALGRLDTLQEAHKERTREAKQHDAALGRLQTRQDRMDEQITTLGNDVEARELKILETLNYVQAWVKREEEEKRLREEEEAAEEERRRKRGLFG